MVKSQAAVGEDYQVSIDENLRKNYDQAHLSAGLTLSASNTLHEVPESPAERKSYLPFSEISVDIGEGPYRGKMLAQIRERMGIDVRAISAETRISLKMLEWIEAEDFERLPAQVYLKGFLKGYAECLGLDPKKVIEDYLEAMGSTKKK